MTDRTLTDGSPVPADDSHKELRADGQQKGYVVLSAEERTKGFIRPVRNSYTHKVCGTSTRMGSSLAETYARSPWFYSGTFCVNCGMHFPLNQFTWDGTRSESMDPSDWSEELVAEVLKRRAELSSKS